MLFFFSFILRAWHGSLQCKICTPVPEQIVESGRLIILILISHPCRTKRPTVIQVFLDGTSVRCSLPPSRLSEGVEYPPKNSARRPRPEIESDFYIWFLATVLFTRLNLLKHHLTVFSFFQSLSMWRRLGAEPLTPLCLLRQSTTFARSEWRRNWSGYARAHARRRLCRHRTTREIQCLFCRKYTGICQTRKNSKIDLKQYSNAMSQKVPLFPLEFSWAENSHSFHSTKQ